MSKIIIDDPYRMSANETARIIGVSPTTLAKWRMADKGPKYLRTGGTKSLVLYALDDVDAWIKAHTVVPSR